MVPGTVTMLPRFRDCIMVLRLMDPWTGLGLGGEFGVARTHVSRFCMTRVVIGLHCVARACCCGYTHA